MYLLKNSFVLPYIFPLIMQKDTQNEIYLINACLRQDYFKHNNPFYFRIKNMLKEEMFLSKWLFINYVCCLVFQAFFRISSIITLEK